VDRAGRWLHAGHGGPERDGRRARVAIEKLLDFLFERYGEVRMASAAHCFVVDDVDTCTLKI